MTHALIIDCNRIVSRDIQEKLAMAGFSSFDHVSTENEAIWAADRRPSKLVVVAHSEDDDASLEAGLYVSLGGMVPLLVVAENGLRTRQRLAGSHRVYGPYATAELEIALSKGGISIVQQTTCESSRVEGRATAAQLSLRSVVPSQTQAIA